MAWIEVHQALPNHRKTLALADSLGLSPVHAMGHVVALWLWSIDNAPDGNLPRVTPKAISLAAHWDGDPQFFLSALIDAGFIEEADGCLAVHDWMDYAGRLVERRAENARRMREARAKQKPITNDERAEHVHNTCDARAGATVPNRTGPDHTSLETNVSKDGADAPSSKTVRNRLGYYEGRLNESPNDNRKAVSIVGDALHECFGVETNYDHVAGMIRRYGAPFEIIKYCFAAVPNWNGTDDPHRYVNGILEDRKQRKEKANGHRASPNGRSVDRSVVNGTAEDMAATFLAKQAREEAERRQRESQNAPA